MTCEDCAKKQEEIGETLDQIRVSQVQAAENLQWIVDTVNGLRMGFEQMMNAGGPLAMLKELRKSRG